MEDYQYRGKEGMKERLDVLLVKRNLAESREKAKAVIMSGIVYVEEMCIRDRFYFYFGRTRSCTGQGCFRTGPFLSLIHI